MATTPQRRASDHKPKKRGQTWVWFGVVAISVLVIGTAVFWPAPGVEETRDGAPNWSPDSRRVIFAAEQGPNGDIFVMDADGNNRNQLTDTPAQENTPSFSPDGQSIAFETDRDGNFEIYVMDADGGNVRRLTNHAGIDRAPAWSPDGTKIAFMSDRDGKPNTDIYVMNADGSNATRITTGGVNWAPQFSPDGRQIAAQRSQDVVIVDLETRAVRVVTSAPENAMNPAWSPRGDRLAFVTTRNRRGEIFTMNPDGSGQRVLVSMPAGSVIDPRWSPDGSRIAFVYLPMTEAAEGQPAERQAIYTIELSSGRLHRLSK